MYTSGLDGLFPQGLLAGRIAVVNSTDTDVFQSAEVAPVWDLEGLETVFIQR